MLTPIYHITNIKNLQSILKIGGLIANNRLKQLYGPYANNLNHVLKHIEGHYIRGYGDGTSKAESAEIYVLPDGREAAQAFLEIEQDAQKHLERVSNLIYGFETPYGMELASNSPLGCDQRI
ncbi:DarT ssDNA thymidine ADP-ribosyltransferase family protein [Nostoc sp. C052]|uniref:DarT ssDNA thymidine ADP-ribosyltransferase family protein n=1 Tax=Nostoc sp. C052 TaxID=2576902 RepID=UPI00277B5234|nr:DarT ssDNA thymidine ADP-ribosyltransferase family protein [Nostoc sp. C052]